MSGINVIVSHLHVILLCALYTLTLPKCPVISAQGSAMLFLKIIG